jgi:hypothetical protein
MNLVQQEVAPQNIFGRAQAQEREVFLHQGLIRDRKSVPELEKKASRFKRIQPAMRQVIPQRHLQSMERIAASFGKDPRQNFRPAKPFHRPHTPESADNNLVGILFKEQDWIQLSNLPQGFQNGRRIEFLADPERFILCIDFRKQYLLDDHAGKNS